MCKAKGRHFEHRLILDTIRITDIGNFTELPISVIRISDIGNFNCRYRQYIHLYSPKIVNKNQFGLPYTGSYRYDCVTQLYRACVGLQSVIGPMNDSEIGRQLID